jgi:hypothetical protein
MMRDEGTVSCRSSGFCGFPNRGASLVQIFVVATNECVRRIGISSMIRDPDLETLECSLITLFSHSIVAKVYRPSPWIMEV